MQDKQPQLRLQRIASVIFWATFLIVSLGTIPEILKTLSSSLAEFAAAIISTFIFLPLTIFGPIIIPIGIVYFLIVWFRKKS